MAEMENSAFAEFEISRITEKDVTIIKKEVSSTEFSISGIRSRRARKIKPKRFIDDEDYMPTNKKVCIKEEIFDTENNEDVQGKQKAKYKKIQNRNIKKKANILPNTIDVDSQIQYPIILDTPKGQIIIKGSYAPDEADSNKSGSIMKNEVVPSGSHVMIQSVHGLTPFVMQGNNEALSAISIGASHFEGAGFILPKIQGSSALKQEIMKDSTESKAQQRRSYTRGLGGPGCGPAGKGWLKSWPPHEPKTTPDILDIQTPPIADSKILSAGYHMSIVPPGDNFHKFRQNIRKCSKRNPVKPNCRNCSLGRNAYHCPLCPHYKALSVTLFNRHVRIHTEVNRRCLHVRGFRIMNCKDICKSRQTSHYHCPFCPTILEKMSRALYHIENCRLPKALQGKIKPTVKCPICSANLSKGSLAEHIRGQHGEERSDPEEIGASRFHFTCLVDATKSIYSSSKSFLGPGTPLHCVLSDSEKFCESRKCMDKMETEKRLGHPDPMCKHMLSVTYAQEMTQDSDIQLSLESLNKLTPLKVSQEMIEKLKELYRGAMKNESPLIVMLPKKPIKNKTGDMEVEKHFMDRQIFFSVFSGNGHHKKFRLGRTIVTKEKSGAIHCRCTKDRDCVHRWLIRWFMYQKGNEPVIELCQKANENLVGSMAAQEAEVTLELHDDDTRGVPVVQRYNNQGTLDVASYPEEDYPNYPPTGRCLKRMIQYIRTQKRIKPDNIPVLYDVGLIPRQLIPSEKICYFCGAALSEPMPSTRRARLILLDQEPLEDFETFYKMCTNNKCNTPYSYREYDYGIFNFNDCYLLSFSFLLHFRENLMNHAAIGRVIKKLPWSSKVSQVMRQTALRDAYFLFESLIDHSYEFFCVRCGYHPKILRHKLMSKAVLVKKGEEVVHHDVQGEVLRNQVTCGNMDNFWIQLTSLPIATAINSIRHKNKITGRSVEIGEFRLSRRDADGALYLGKQTRRPDYVSSYSVASEEMRPSENSTQSILQDGQSKDVVSENDILISEEPGISNNTGADRTSSPGWFISACPHGVTYSIKNDLFAKGAGALVDVLSNFEHIPTVNISENADAVANIGNTRFNEMFTPHKGRLAEASEENVSMAQDDNILVHLDYMRDEDLIVSSLSGEVHPITGTANKHMLFPSTGQHHQPLVEKLRGATLVPELSGKIDTTELQELFNGIEADCYWLNFLSPSNHLFTMRLLAHLRNKKINDEELQVQGRILNATMTTITYGRSDTLTETTIDLALNHLGQIIKCPPASTLINTSSSVSSSKLNDKTTSGSSIRNTSAVNSSFINPTAGHINALVKGKIPSNVVIKNPVNLPKFILNGSVDVNIVRSFFSEEGWAAVEDVIQKKRNMEAEEEAMFSKMTNKEKQEKILSLLVTDDLEKQIISKTRYGR